MSTVPSPDLGVQPDLSESPAHVTTVPNAQLSLVPQTVNSSLAQNQNQGLFHFPQIPNLGFAPTLNSDFDPNSQGSLMDLMSEAMYTLPNHDKQELDQDLFNFGRFQDLEKNTSNEDTNVSLPSINVSLVLHAAWSIDFIHIHSSPPLLLRTAPISTATLPKTLPPFPTSLASWTPCSFLEPTLTDHSIMMPTFSSLEPTLTVRPMPTLSSL